MVRVCGLAAGVELMKNPDTHTPYPFEEKMGIRVCKEALTHGGNAPTSCEYYCPDAAVANHDFSVRHPTGHRL